MILHDVEWVQKNYADAAGATVLEVRSGCYAPGAKKERTVVFKCSKCGAVSEMGLNHLIYRHQNTEFHCNNCKVRKKPSKVNSYTYTDIKKLFDENNVILLSPESEFKGVLSTLRYICKSCGKETFVKLPNILYRPHTMPYNFLCSDCVINSSPTIEYIEEKYFKPVGAKLLTREYKNAYTLLDFECSNCGKPWKVNYHNLSCSGNNSMLLCGDCMGKRSRDILKEVNADSWEHLRYRRTIYDQNFGRHIGDFFNIPSDIENQYTYHHVLPYFKHHEFAMSITNIFPLKRKVHSFTKSKDSYYQKLHIPFVKPRLFINDYPDEFKLPFQDESFRFFNPQDYIIVDVIIPEYNIEKSEVDAHFENRVDASISGSLLKVKQNYYNKGILYIPIFYSEYFTKRPIIRSMLMIRGEKLYSGFSKMYGFNIEKLYARKCVVKNISSEQAFKFFEKTHMQGGVKAKHNYGLFYNDELVGCMSFGAPRVKSDNSAQYEMYRLSYKNLTVVAGGTSKLFNFALKDLNPLSIVSYCDLRFTSLDENDSVYNQLGFICVKKTKPNYRYYDPKTHSLYGRMSYQKHLLKNKLEFFDPNLSEKENCKLNGLVPQYDCGNIKYVWENPVFVGVKPG